MGIGEAWGLRERNECKRFLESASADVFWTPGRWRAVSVISYTAQRSARRRRSRDRVGSLADFLLMAHTTAALSQREQTLDPAHCGPHRAMASTMGAISFGAIVIRDQWLGHDS